MEALNAFFSELVTVRGGGMKKEPGYVRAFFRNGKFTKDIAKQGQFDIPVLRRTLVGHIQAMNIVTGIKTVRVEVPQVSSSEGFIHPLVVVKLLLRLNNSDGYGR